MIPGEIDIPRLFQAFCVLADTPVDPSAFTNAVRQLGWSVEENKYPPEGEIVLKANSPFGNCDLTAVFGKQNIAGMPLFVLINDENPESPYYLTSQVEFDDIFDKIRREIEGNWGAAVVSGTYEDNFVSGVFHYTLWPRHFWYVALIQHPEGDANYGHGPTLDLRLLPLERQSGLPAFPLNTDLIF
jgi:hypothetical protein